VGKKLLQQLPLELKRLVQGVKMASNRIVTISPLNEPNASLTSISLGLKTDAIYTPASGGGGWQVVERPKRVAAIQWFDRALWQLTVEGIINTAVTDQIVGFAGEDAINISIENECTRLESWANAIPNTLEPPHFALSGPVPGIHHTWIIFSMEFGAAIRHPQEGYRYQQEVKIVFYEYAPPYGNQTSSTATSPTEAYYYNREVGSGSSSFQLYTITQGDTLQGIASKFNLGSVSPASPAVTSLLQINGIRDPRTLVPGQTIILPQ